MGDSLSGKSAIVTGAAGGIGAACARHLAAEGAQVLLVDRNAEGLDAVAAEIGALARAFPADITSEADMAAMAEAALEATGRIDILVAAAGILRVGGTLKPVAQTTFEEWKTVIDVNLTGTFLSNRAVLAAMLAQKEGDIVNISSVSGKQGRAFDGPYASSKFGIVGLSESLAEEVQREGVRVQTVLPDAVDTELWAQSGTAALKPRAMLSPERVAEFVHYLVTLPRDAFLFNSVVAPVPMRKRRGKAKG
ncbi:Ribitol 2-dehydrogenase [Roseivivax sp. THAF40]|uniref:SDR family oxidoreductase n=1 Tax=unclassified Roseivivax TaxID=2639302 RepID=UPI0012A87CD2|nr:MULTISPECIES: SDR family oxidoreductase [unclassified Roseivivax]QFS84156.1 Ribitol 2-dehydrogenase [Roseivivax sp. THAF197b]QFT47984.1 Ribitol 2-dehydrogenase [Roseivivax sp. THAF40]